MRTQLAQTEEAKAAEKGARKPGRTPTRRRTQDPKQAKVKGRPRATVANAPLTDGWYVTSSTGHVGATKKDVGSFTSVHGALARTVHPLASASIDGERQQ